MNDAKPLVFVVDDDSVTRDAVCRLAASVGLASIAYASAAEFLEAYDPKQAGCLVLDVRMPDMSGLELQSWLTEKDVCLPIIFLSGHADVDMAVTAVKAGAFDFMQKPFRAQPLLDTINKAITKDAESRRAQIARAEYDALVSNLTRRERQTMELLISGKTSKGIALELGLSPKTVDYHRHHVMQKMAVETVVQLTRLVPPGR